MVLLSCTQSNTSNQQTKSLPLIMPKKGIFSGQDQWLRLLVTEYTVWRYPFLVANFNTMKNTWRDIIARPFMGWAFVVNIVIAWILLLIIKAVASSNGYMIGGLLATFILFSLAWLVGLPRVLTSKRENIEAKSVEVKPHSKKDYKKILKVIGGISLVLLAWYGLVKYNDSKGLERFCIQVIDFNGSVYKMNDEVLFQDAPRFRTYNEAMDYCKVVANRILNERQ